MQNNNAIEIYISDDGQVKLDIKLDAETVWMTQVQIAALFDTSTDNISLHLKNIYHEGELQEMATTEDFSVVRQEGNRQVNRTLKHYNLDAVLSVGYRVSSARATQFRIWATQRLKDYLVQGYALNQQRFDQNAAELQQAIALIRKAAQAPDINATTGRGLVEIVSRYTQTFLWLQRYDEGLLNDPQGQTGGDLPTPEIAMQALQQLSKC